MATKRESSGGGSLVGHERRPHDARFIAQLGWDEFGTSVDEGQELIVSL